MKKYRIGIVGYNEKLERSFFQTSILEDLKSQFEVDILTTYESSSRIKVTRIESYFTQYEIKLFALLTNLCWITYRKQSSSFIFRFKRMYLSDFNWIQKKDKGSVDILFLVKRLLNTLEIILKTKSTFWFLVPFKKKLLHILSNRIPQNKKILSVLGHYDFVIIHSSGVDKYTSIICNTLSKSKTLSLIVAENWDNLTSKQVMLFKPNFVTSIGDIDFENIKRIHGFTDSQVLSIGLPKLYFLKDVNRNVNRTEDDFKIYYVGFYLPHDEINLLNNLVEEIAQSGVKATIFYRPHPKQAVRLSNRILDQRIVKISHSINHSTGLMDLNDAYKEDLLNADLVIGPPTTLILEAMIAKCPVLIDLTDDRVHRTTARKAATEYLHIKDFVRVFKDLTFHEISELIPMIQQLVDQNSRVINYKDLSKVVTDDTFMYGLKLSEFIEEKLESNRNGI